jgi:hypothetical protein
MSSVLRPQKVSNRSLHIKSKSERDIFVGKNHKGCLPVIQSVADDTWNAGCISDTVFLKNDIPVSDTVWEADCDSFRSVFGILCIKEFPRPAQPKPLDDMKIAKLDDVPLSMIDSYKFSDIYGGEA